MLDSIQDGLSRPMEQEYLNRTIGDAQRVTLLSVYNFITQLVRAGAVLAGGIAIDYGGMRLGFLLAAALLVVFTAPLSAWFLRQSYFASPARGG